MPDPADARPVEGNQREGTPGSAEQMITVAIPGLSRPEQEAIRAALEALNSDTAQAVIEEVRLNNLVPSQDDVLGAQLRAQFVCPPADYQGQKREDLEVTRESCRAVIRRIMRKITQVLGDPTYPLKQIQDLGPLLRNLGRQLFHESLLTLIIRGEMIGANEVASRKAFYLEHSGILAEVKYLYQSQRVIYPKLFSPEFPLESGGIVDVNGYPTDESAQLPASIFRDAANEDIPHFDGNYQEWDTFWAQFKTLVDDNPRISTIIKFRRLLKALQGDAKNQVRNFRYTVANYEPVKRHLQKVYGEPERILQHVRERLANISSMRSDPPYPEFCKFALLAQEYIRMLLHHSPQGGYSIADTIFLIRKKLPASSTARWIDYSRDKDPANAIKDMDLFLGNEMELWRMVHLDKMGSEKSQPKNTQQGKGQKGGKPTTYNLATNAKTKSQPAGKEPATDVAKTTPGEDKDLCLFCNGKHQLVQCKNDLSPDDRKRILLKNRRCLVCMKAGHPASKCTAARCSQCDGKHHNLVHGSKFIPLRSKGKRATDSSD